MQNTKIYRRRIERTIERIYSGRYSEQVALSASFIYDQESPIPIDRIENLEFRSIQVGEKWGEIWGSAWFRFEGEVQKGHEGKEVLALIDVEGEGCVFVDGVPERGITYKHQEPSPHIKRRVPIATAGNPGQKVSLLVEAGANGLFGRGSDGIHGSEAFYLRQAEIVAFDRERWQLSLDMFILLDLYDSLPEDSPRAHKILHGLNEVANEWRDGDGLRDCKKITEALLASRANASDMTVYSIGHAHIDLGWLWPVRETKRKGARTFSTALRLMEEYPSTGSARVSLSSTNGSKRIIRNSTSR